jgi:hypothetical protein
MTWLARKKNNKTQELNDKLANGEQASSVGCMARHQPGHSFGGFLSATASNTSLEQQLET